MLHLTDLCANNTARRWILQTPGYGRSKSYYVVGSCSLRGRFDNRFDQHFLSVSHSLVGRPLCASRCSGVGTMFFSRDGNDAMFAVLIGIGRGFCQFPNAFQIDCSFALIFAWHDVGMCKGHY